jgi:hypothetical protein
LSYKSKPCIAVYEINPLQDIRWSNFLETHRKAGLFHSVEWLAALERSYGFQASVLTTSRPGEHLTNGLVFCRINSRLTGRRLTSVPFSDHCMPLTDSEEEFGYLSSRLQQEADEGGNQYLEIRSIAANAVLAEGLTVSGTFCLHQLDLSPTLDELLHAFHGDCIRRKIKRAEREGVTYDEGTSEELLQKFYQLVMKTRRRQGIPPQPLFWFRNLISCFGESLTIRLASHGGQPIAGVLTIRYKSTMTYKYGCSDSRFHKLGPMQLLMWRAIQEAKEEGLLKFDMGRTDWSNKGLLAFKDRWGGTRSTLVYLGHPALTPPNRAKYIPAGIVNRVLASMPDSVLSAASNVLYRHLA